MLNINEQRVLNEILKKKQTFVNKAIQELSKGNKEKAAVYINLEAGLSIDIIKLIQGELR